MHNKEINEYENLKKLKKIIEDNDIEKFTKEKILKVIDFEIQCSEGSLFRKLGESSYKKEFESRNIALEK